MHRMLYDKLPRDTVHWGHEVVSFQQSEDGLMGVRVEVKVSERGETVVVDGDLLIAADGSMSLIRKHLLPHQHRRYNKLYLFSLLETWKLLPPFHHNMEILSNGRE